jgi:hypothetical protein
MNMPVSRKFTPLGTDGIPKTSINTKSSAYLLFQVPCEAAFIFMLNAHLPMTTSKPMVKAANSHSGDKVQS